MSFSPYNFISTITNGWFDAVYFIAFWFWFLVLLSRKFNVYIGVMQLRACMVGMLKQEGEVTRRISWSSVSKVTKQG
jgi:hypothetical protein